MVHRDLSHEVTGLSVTGRSHATTTRDDVLWCTGVWMEVTDEKSSGPQPLYAAMGLLIRWGLSMPPAYVVPYLEVPPPHLEEGGRQLLDGAVGVLVVQAHQLARVCSRTADGHTGVSLPPTIHTWPICQYPSASDCDSCD